MYASNLFYLTINVSFNRRTICDPMSFTSGHCRITNIAMNMKKTVVKTRTLFSKEREGEKKKYYYREYKSNILLKMIHEKKKNDEEAFYF